MPQSSRDLPPHLRPLDAPLQPELAELPPPDEPPPLPPPELEAPPRPLDPFLRQS